MGSFSGLCIGLSFLFGCILMGLVAELYYLLWWKKKLAKTTSINSSSATSSSGGGGEFQEFNLLFFWRRPRSFGDAQDAQSHREIQDLEVGPTTKEAAAAAGLKCEEGIEAELMRVHNLCGPPRFLFTIKEESREDLESEEGRSRKGGGSRTRSLSGGGGTPFLTPLSSPPTTLKATTNSLDSFNYHGINPLFETVPEAEVRASPPPKFKFLRDAEEKLMRRRMREEEERNLRESVMGGEKFGSFVKFLSVREQGHSQVLPLPSSPPLEHRL